MKYNFKGLSDEAVAKSREQNGSNELPPAEIESFTEKLMENFQDPLIKILIIALVIILALAFVGKAEWYEAVGIASAVFLATFVSTYSEYKNETSFQLLQEKASRVKNNVFRNGSVLVNIFASELVVGDYILLQAGDKVPADGVLVSGDLDVNQATLNGESKAVKKLTAPASYAPKNANDFDDKYLTFRGTVVESGEGVIYVRAVGINTEYGRLADKLRQSDDRESPLQVKLSALADGISLLGYVGSAFIAISFLFKQFVMDNHYNWPEIITYVSNWQVALHDVVTSVILAIIIIVVAVPEGLPMMIAIVLSLNMRTLLRSNVLVRKLLGIETAGSIDILFVDKTGTITRGTFEPKLFVTGDLQEYKGFPAITPALQEALGFALRESTSAVISPEGDIVGGNASDKALLQFLSKNVLLTKVDTSITHQILFDSGRKFSAVALRIPTKSVPRSISSLSSSSGAAQSEIGAFKGAPEVILPRCSHFITANGERQALTQLKPLTQKINDLSSKGIRVVAVALTENTKFDADHVPENGFTLVGVVGVYDEIRPESEPSIKLARQAGIQVVMITGDKQETAVNIAQQAGLLDKDKVLSNQVLTSEELLKLDDKQLGAAIKDLRVIARALPSDKLRFVEVAQQHGKVVGMTGDGVNDSAALKQADVGFAMGSGSEVSKEAADIVILDDNFSSITQAVLYGRTIYKSIQKFIVFQSTINFSSSLIVFLGPFLGVDFPLTLIQLLWVNLVMDTLAALAFAGEPALTRYMRERPIKRDQAIITPYMWWSLLTGGAFIAAMSIFALMSHDVKHMFVRGGAANEPAFQTGFFAFFIFLCVINAFNVRTPKANVLENIGGNRGFTLVLLFIFVVQIFFSYVGGRVLRTVGLTLNEWGVVILSSLVVIPFGIAQKKLFNIFLSQNTEFSHRTDKIKPE